METQTPYNSQMDRFFYGSFERGTLVHFVLHFSATSGHVPYVRRFSYRWFRPQTSHMGHFFRISHGSFDIRMLFH